MKYLDNAGNEHKRLIGAYFSDIKRFISNKKNTKITPGKSSGSINHKVVINTPMVVEKKNEDEVTS